MRRLAAIAPALFLAMSLGAPARAAVDAPRALVAPAEAAALAQRLDRLGEYHFDVVIVRALAEAPEVVARQMFLAHQKGPYDGLIVVAVGDGHGDGFLGFEADQLSQQAREVLTTAPVDGARAETLLGEAAQQLGKAKVSLSTSRPRPAGETAWETAPYVVTRIAPRAEGAPAPARGPNGTHELS